MGELPAITLPLIAAVLGGFYEVDNTPEDEKKEEGKDAKGAKSDAKVRVAEEQAAAEEEEELEEAPKKAKK